MSYYLAFIVGIVTAYISAYHESVAIVMFIGTSIWFYLYIQLEARGIWKDIFKWSPVWYKRWVIGHNFLMPCVFAIWIGYLVGPIVESYAI
ncbi:hypothetical protein [Pseudomonas phage PA1C]|nr:hypothetical protein [Pseudomonas phage PA1C]BEG72543.1 hypothetical protein RVBP21_1710 [Pseudomonas phage BRkr]